MNSTKRESAPQAGGAGASIARPSDATALEALRVLAAWLAPVPMVPMVKDALLGPRDVGITPRTWRAAVRRGDLIATQVGRAYLARREDVARWLESRRVQPKAKAPPRIADDAATRAVERARADGRLRVVGGRS